MSELSVQNEVQDQDEDKCFVCFQPNNKESIPIPCLNNHPDKIHKKCYEDYSKRFPNCFCGNLMHIPKRDNETMVDYWSRCCQGDSKSCSIKIVHGVVRFKNLINNEEVTKEFTVTSDSIKGCFQYIDENVSIWEQLMRQDIPHLISIGSKSKRFYFMENGSILGIFSVKSL
jgi:hypothetical protein